MGLGFQGTPRIPFFVSASGSAPASPIVGDLWYTSDTLILYSWNGSAWSAVIQPAEYKLLSETVLANNTTNLVSSGAIPTGYKEIHVTGTVRAFDNANSLLFTINTNTGSIYTFHELRQAAATLTGNDRATQTSAFIVGEDNIGASPTTFTLRLHNATTAQALNKGWESDANDHQNGKQNRNTGICLDTNEISSVEIKGGGTMHFTTGDIIRFYGVK